MNMNSLCENIRWYNVTTADDLGSITSSSSHQQDASISSTPESASNKHYFTDFLSTIKNNNKKRSSKKRIHYDDNISSIVSCNNIIEFFRCQTLLNFSSRSSIHLVAKSLVFLMLLLNAYVILIESSRQLLYHFHSELQLCLDCISIDKLMSFMEIFILFSLSSSNFRGIFLELRHHCIYDRKSTNLYSIKSSDNPSVHPSSLNIIPGCVTTKAAPKAEVCAFSGSEEKEAKRSKYPPAVNVNSKQTTIGNDLDLVFQKHLALVIDEGSCSVSFMTSNSNTHGENCQNDSFTEGDIVGLIITIPIKGHSRIRGAVGGNSNASHKQHNSNTGRPNILLHQQKKGSCGIKPTELLK